MKKKILFTILTLLGMSQAMAEELVPLVREGVQWVNEKVIINNGDTTRYYYKYEFKGYDSETNLSGDINNACYYYIGDTLNIEQDSLIAGLRETYKVTCYRNEAYRSAVSAEKTMFPLYIYSDGGTFVLYDFISLYEGMNYYLMCQYYWSLYSDNPEFINENNFIKISPINIDGYECKRYAYIGEQGDTLCYVVESIGFDSRDMGDLLTPFMLPPDHTADYQEYWGLSHVVKDGKIIYKGMRYREDIETGIEEVEAEQPNQAVDGNYYNLMGQPVGKQLPRTPGIYIHNGKKICVGPMP